MTVQFLNKSAVTKICLMVACGLSLQAHARKPVDDDPDFADGSDFNNPPPGDNGNSDSDPVTGVTLGQPTLDGTGCPQAHVSATLAPDNSALSILFDNYSVNLGGSNSQTRE